MREQALSARRHGREATPPRVTGVRRCSAARLDIAARRKRRSKRRSDSGIGALQPPAQPSAVTQAIAARVSDGSNGPGTVSLGQKQVVWRSARCGGKEEAAMTDQTGLPEVPDMRLELVPVPVSDVERAKAFYQQAGFGNVHDTQVTDSMRVVQFTPPARRARSSSGPGWDPSPTCSLDRSRGCIWS